MIKFCSSPDSTSVAFTTVKKKSPIAPIVSSLLLYILDLSSVMEVNVVECKGAGRWYPDSAEGAEDNSVQQLLRQLSPPVSALEVLDPPRLSPKGCHCYQGD